jgi:purine-binding chemotaxis protein CheW
VAAAVIVRLGTKKIALMVHEIDRVLRAVAITPLPKKLSGILGVITIEGVVTKVVDIGQELGVESGEISLDDQIVVMNCASGKTAIVVDGVEGVRHFSDDQLTVVNNSESTATQAFLCIDDELIMVCNPDSFLNPEQK